MKAGTSSTNEIANNAKIGINLFASPPNLKKIDIVENTITTANISKIILGVFSKKDCLNIIFSYLTTSLENLFSKNFSFCKF